MGQESEDHQYLLVGGIDEDCGEESGTILDGASEEIGSVTYAWVRHRRMKKRRYANVEEVCKQNGYRWRNMVP